VAAQGPAYQCDLTQVGARTAIRATRQTQQDGLVRQAVLVEQGLELGQKLGQIAFALGHGQATGGQRYAGNAVASYTALLFVPIQPVFCNQLVDFCTILGADIGDDQVLVACHAEFAFVNLGDFADAGLQLQAVFVPQSARLDIQAQMPLSV